MSLPSSLAPPPYVNVNDSETDQHSHSLSSMDKLKPAAIITLIISITVLSICLLLYHINRRCHRHLSTTNSRRVSPENPPTSSSSVFLDSLPLFTYSSVTRRSTSSAGDNGGDCAVCLSKFEPQDQLRLLPLCCHAFHADCIDTWLQSNLTCPLCRSEINASESDVTNAIQASSAGRSWVKDYVDRLSYSLSSRTLWSGRFFSGSIGRNDTGEYDMESNNHDCGELFRWFLGV